MGLMSDTLDEWRRVLGVFVERYSADGGYFANAASRSSMLTLSDDIVGPVRDAFAASDEQLGRAVFHVMQHVLIEFRAGTDAFERMGRRLRGLWYQTRERGGHRLGHS